MADLIYDRAKADVDRAIMLDGKMARGTASEAERAEWMAGAKGAINVADLNRFETQTALLRDRLRERGYLVAMTVKNDWTRGDLPNHAEIDRIRRNIDALQKGFYSLPDWREIVYHNRLGFEQANAMEWDLHTLGAWLDRMVAAFYYAGEIYGGEL